MSINNEGRITDLTNWAKHHGCTFHSVHISNHPQYGDLGIFNTKHTFASNQDEHLAIFVPYAIIISSDVVSEEAQHDKELQNVLNALPDTPTVEPILSVFLLYHLYLLRSGGTSKWSVYIENLPKTSLRPIHWNQEEIVVLQLAGTSISRAILAKLSFLKTYYDALRQVDGWFQTITWDDYLLAESWVSSRTLSCPRNDKPILVPILDLVNHSSVRNAAWEMTLEGVELIREPVDIPAGGEVAIAYDLDRGTGERLYRYGFIEDESYDCISKEVVLFDVSPSRVFGGNVVRLRLEVVKGGFSDLSFLNYENWMSVLPVCTDTRQLGCGFGIWNVRQDGEHGDPRIAICPQGGGVKQFDTPDLESILNALKEGGVFPQARVLALEKLKALVGYHRDKIWRPSQQDDYETALEHYPTVRREIWNMVKIWCVQEGKLLDEAWDVLVEQLSK